ncbi:MAG TPA: hypothetical protein VFL70_03685, partial [Bacteroidia bacterium]|nr:hypothetical protein [Bacteroidia bacterium]
SPFWKQIIQQIFIQLILTGGVWYFFQKSFEDSLIAARFKEEMFVKEKREVYYEAIEMACRQMAITDYKTNLRTGKLLPPMKRNRGALRPTELELNLCYFKLYLYAGNRDVIDLYFKMMTPKDGDIPVDNMKEFLNVIKKDIGNTYQIDKTFELLYIVSDTSGKKLEI